MPPVDPKDLLRVNVESCAGIVSEAQRAGSVVMFAIGLDASGRDSKIHIFAASEMGAAEACEICAAVVRLYELGKLTEVINGQPR